MGTFTVFRFKLPLAVCVCALFTETLAQFLNIWIEWTSTTASDDYVNRAESVYGWENLNGSSFKTVFGGTAHLLNVTSQTYLDASRGQVVTNVATNVWRHTVAVIVPKERKLTNTSVAYLTGGCNSDGLPKSTSEDILVADEIAHSTGSVAIVVFQIPNCPMVYPSDPSKRKRDEDALIAWAWKEFLDDANHDATWLPRLPMVKGAMQSMRAAEEFLGSQIDKDHGWIVAGASKRGWTTWMVGSVACASCPKIRGIAPLVPIVPDLHAEMHRQWQSYGGWTFAFKDYTDVNMTSHIDDDVFVNGALKVIDPKYYYDRLAKIPKVVVLSSDDEFMSFDWSNIWYDDMQANAGETHLMIAQNSEHSLATGLPEVLSCLGTFATGVALKKARPSFSYSFDASDGSIAVTINGDYKPSKVVLRHAQTISSTRRDFRWVRLSNNSTRKCTLPEIHLSKPVFGADCFVPIVWIGTTLSPSSSDGSTYTAKPPAPTKQGHYTGYFIEVYFPSDVGGPDYQFTTPGYTYPNTLPYADCKKSQCAGTLL